VINAYTGVAEWVDPPRPLIYSVFTPHEPCMQALGRWAAKDGHKKILLVYFDAAVARAFSQHAVAAARAVNPNVQVELMPIKMGTTDYVPHALEIIRQKPDAVIGATILNEFLTMARELRANGSTVPLYTTTYNVFDSLAALNPQAVEGTKAFTFTQSPLADTPAVKEYRAAMAKYIKPALTPDFPSLFTFAGAKIFVEALSRIKGELTHPALFAALDSMKDYDTGILPPVSFSPSNHQGTNALFKMVAKGGRWVGTGEVVDAGKNVW
jgi:ABC-type branched-subunit amino acid transport system substrate-binding protein